MIQEELQLVKKKKSLLNKRLRDLVNTLFATITKIFSLSQQGEGLSFSQGHFIEILSAPSFPGISTKTPKFVRHLICMLLHIIVIPEVLSLMIWHLVSQGHSSGPSGLPPFYTMGFCRCKNENHITSLHTPQHLCFTSC